MPDRDSHKEQKSIALLIAVLAFVGIWAIFELCAWSVKRNLIAKHPKRRNRVRETYH